MSESLQHNSVPPDPVRVLIVDDDVELCRGLERLLKADGFVVTFAHDVQDGYDRALSGNFDLIVLDVMLPGGDGRVLLNKVRTMSDVPVIMLTARGDEKDRIRGLEAGADDYLPKPFNTRELLARMRAVLRRRLPHGGIPHTFTVGDLMIDHATRTVSQHGENIPLTGTEFDILLYMAKALGRVVSRDELATACLGRSIGVFDRSVDNHISNLRKKLGPTYLDKERIQNLRGTGYVYTGTGE